MNLQEDCMSISLLDNSLKVQIFYEESDAGFEDNICICINEDCRDEERLFRGEQTQIYLSVKEAKALAQELLDAIEDSEPRR
jgi:hypothetical protein